MLDKTQENANPPLFEGTVYTIRIKSNCICYGPCPEPSDEVEQHLTVTADGKVSFSSYCWGDGGKYKKMREQNFKIHSDIASYILKIVGDYFSADNEMNFATDVGSWEMDMSNTDEKSFHFTGSLCPGVSELDNISSIMRYNLNMPNLLAFDGDSHKDRIDKLVIDYHRVTKIKPKVPFNPEIEYATWDYSEHITLDRVSESLEHIQNIGSGCTVSRKYHVEDGLSAFLDGHYSSGLLSNIIGNPPDVIDDPLETKDYKINVDYLYGGQRVISGSFDKNGLPEDFPELAEDIMNFMCFYGMGEILNPSVYKKAKRKNSDYIFCSVEFEDGGKSYYYLTEDDTLQIGDSVFVPVSKDGRTAIAEITNIEYFSEDDVPFPLDKVKSIIRKCTDEDFSTPSETENMEQNRTVYALTEEPLKSSTPADIRLWLQGHAAEHDLACAFAGVHNQTGWLMHDLDELDNPELEKAYEEWRKLEAELCASIIRILDEESPVDTEIRKQAGKGTHHIVTPFMIKNGYIDGGGWWIEASNGPES